jgi:hypothetical protein
LEGLKEAITQEVAAIPLKMTRRVMGKYRERLKQYIDNEGHHLSGAVFKLKTALCILFEIKKILLGLAFISFLNRGVLSAAPCTSIRTYLRSWTIDVRLVHLNGIMFQSKHVV